MSAFVETVECPICGAMVADLAKHEGWHQRLRDTLAGIQRSADTAGWRGLT